jgi:UDP-GlcNAc:undecaprenyl-phosphate GlcNAc-1-phosphate transferase
MPLQPYNIIWIAVAFGLALTLTPLVRRLALRWGMMAKPSADRWHKKPTAMLGGVAIFLTVLILYVVAMPKTQDMLIVVGASGFLWLVGLVDDLWRFKPYQKLIGQVMGAAIVIYGGLILPWTPWLLLNMGITLLWLVGITNAINLLDNMDGLAAGIAAIASVFLAVHFYDQGMMLECLLLGIFAAALLGFLVFNTSPASIFMGDCGSMFIGFFLAATALLDVSQGRTRSFLPVLAVPVLVLCIPIFDVVFVTILRKLAGRSVAQGGRDHTSHRLVALGLSERRAVVLLYTLAAGSGLLSLLVRDLPWDQSVAAITLLTLALTALGVFLAGVKVYSEGEIEAASKQPLIGFLINLSYKRRIFEVLLDVLLVLLAYYGAHVLLFGSAWQTTAAWDLFIQTLPVLVFIKLAALLLVGVYRGLWRYVSVDSLVCHAKAVVLGSLLCVAVVLLLFRFEGFSRAVFVLDGVLFFGLLSGSRMAFRFLRRLLPHPSRDDARRVLIYGAGDGGELLARELLSNRSLNTVPVGFMDDDPMKKGKVIHGLRVLGGNGSFLSICSQQDVKEVVISSNRFTEERVRDILSECRKAGITLKRMRIQIDFLNQGEAI